MPAGQPSRDSASGDSFGTVYKGSLLLPLFTILLVIALVWMALKKRR